jgi:NADPH:quinone reductase-like Zn-dependent oxidoreductase
MKAVQYDGFGPIDVLEVRDVPAPQPAAGEVVVEVRAAGINPGETNIRNGALADLFPSTFPSGQGSDLAGVITELGGDVSGWQVGDEVLGWVDTRSSQAEYAAVAADQLIAKPASVPWEVAGGLFVAGATAWAAVRAVALQPGETVVVSGAAGGVGGLVVQLAVERGATVLGIAGEANHPWLASHNVTPIEHAGGLGATADRVRAAAPGGIDAFIDTFGQGYVDLALGLGVATDRINTVIDFAAASEHGVQSAGNAAGANVADLTEIVNRLADGRLELTIAATYPLTEVRAAFTELDQRHTRGKIVLIP